MDLKIGVIRLVLFVSNGIFACTGVAILAMSAVIFKEMRVFSQVGDFMDSKYAGILITLIVVGSLVILVTLFGFYGTVRENQRILMAFAVMLFVIYVFEIVLSTLAFLRSNDIDIGVKNAMTKSFQNYRFNPTIFHSYNKMQRDLKCCGVDGPTDYLLIFGNNSVPSSCCYRYDGYMCRQSFNDHDIHQGGCFNGVRDFVARTGVILGSVTLSLAFSEVLAIVFALLLIILLYREEKKMGIHLKPGYKFEAVEMELQEGERKTQTAEDMDVTKPPLQDAEALKFQPQDIEVLDFQLQDIDVLDFEPQSVVKPPPEITEAPETKDSPKSSPESIKALKPSPETIKALKPSAEDIHGAKSSHQDIAVSKTTSENIEELQSISQGPDISGNLGLSIESATPEIE